MLPDSLSLYEVSSYGGIKTRVDSYSPSMPQSGYLPGQIITFQLPLQNLDLRNSSWQFSLNCTAPGSTYAYFNKDIRSIIQRMTLSFGSKIIFDCQNANLLFNVMDQLKETAWADSAGKLLYGTGDQVSRQADFTNVNRYYCVQLYNLNSELLSFILPLSKLNVQLYINIYLAPVANCITTDSLAPTYVVNENQFHCSFLETTPEWEQLWAAKISRGIAFNYLNYENTFDSSLLTAGISRASKTLQFRYSSLVGIIFVMRPLANINSQTAVDKLSRYDFNNLSGVQCRIGSFVTPTDITTNFGDRYTMLMQQFGYSTKVAYAASQNFNTTNFIGAVNFSRHPYQRMDASTSINGIDTSINSAVILDLTFSSPLGANYSIDIYGLSECSVVFLSNGGINWQT